MCINFFFFNDTATTEIYTLSLHDALPIFDRVVAAGRGLLARLVAGVAEEAVVSFQPVDRVVAEQAADRVGEGGPVEDVVRSEEHTSELQSRQYLVCRLLLEKKKNQYVYIS